MLLWVICNESDSTYFMKHRIPVYIDVKNGHKQKWWEQSVKKSRIAVELHAVINSNVLVVLIVTTSKRILFWEWRCVHCRNDELWKLQNVMLFLSQLQSTGFDYFSTVYLKTMIPTYIWRNTSRAKITSAWFCKWTF